MVDGNKKVSPLAALSLLAFCLALAGGMLSYTVAGEPRVGILKGRVLDKSGRPVVGVYVTVATHDYSQSFDVKTGTDGRWVSPRTPVGINNISFQRRGYQYASTRSEELKEAKIVTVETVYLRDAPDNISVGVRYPQTVLPGKKKGLYINGTYNQPAATVTFSVYPYDLVAGRLQPNGEYDYRSAYLKQLSELTPVAQWKRTYQTSDYDGSFNGEPAVPSIDEPGGYLVVARLGGIEASDILNVSRIAVIAKNDGKKLLTYTVDASKGNAIPGARVAAYSRSGLITEGVSDSDGLCTFDITTQQETIVVSSHDKSSAIANSYSYGRSETANLIYTDRPIYRPGHTVHFKGIFRKKHQGGYIPITGQQINFEVTDPEGSKVAEVKATTNENGTASGQWESSSNGNLGNYQVTVDQAGLSASSDFSIEEYRKPEYSVTVKPQQDVVIQGDSFKALVQASYYFGAPVADSEVNYTIYTSPYYYYGDASDLEIWADGDNEEYGYEYGGYGEVVREGKAVTDKDGRLLIDIPTKGVSEISRWTIEVSVVDASMKESTARASSVIAPADFYIDTQPVQYVVSPTEKARISVNNVWWNNAAPKPQQLDVLVEKVDWNRTREVRENVIEGSLNVPAGKQADFECKLKEAGYYEIIFSGRDQKGRRSESATSVYVYQNGEDWDAYPPEDRVNAAVTVVPQKTLYQPGQTASVMIGSSQKGANVLVTLQGGQLFRQWVLPGGVQQVIEIPLLSDYGTGVIVTASMVRDSTMVWHQAQIAISPEKSFLNVKIKSSRPVYKPGETAEYSIQTMDKNGKGVSAEVSFGVVDESIYALRADSTPELQKYFWGPASDNVSTATSLEDYYYGGVNKFDSSPRKYFPDTAYWNPTLRTDNTGFAYVSFKVPDNLTTWRATARAVTTDTKVGQAIQKCLVTKDLVVRLQAPRFFRQKDRMSLGVIVHNYTDRQQSVSIRLKAEGLKQSGELVRFAKIKPGSIAKVTYPIEAVSPGSSRLTAEAITDDRSAIDSVQLDFPVLPYGSPDLLVYSGRTDSKGSTTVNLPASAVKGSQSLTIHVTTNPIGAALQGLEYLTGYPWGCTEQTVSSFVPNLLLRRAMSDIGYPISNISQQNLDDMIASGIKRLKDLQNPDGSWGFFTEGVGDEAMTAYAVQSLIDASSAGVNVPKQMISDGRAWLVRQTSRKFPSPPEKVGGSYRLLLEDRSQTVLAISVSGGDIRKKVQELYAVRKHATDFSLACMGLAALSQGMNAEAVQIAKDLQTKAVRGAGWVYWTDSLNWSYVGDRGATAQVAKFLIRLGGIQKTAVEALMWLTANRTADRWSATRDTASIISATIDFLSQARPSVDKVSISLNGKLVTTVALSPADAFKPPVAVNLSASKIKEGKNSLVVRSTTQQSFWTAKLDYFDSAPPQSDAQSYFRLSRQLYKVRVKGTRDGMSEKLSPVGDTVQVGEIVRLKLQLTAKGASAYNLVEIPLPAGFEVVNRQREWRRSYSGEQIRDNRIGLFARWTPRGKSEWTYDIRPEVPGKINVMPARIEAMYKPEWNAHSDLKTLEVRP